ncbi:MAG: hypothetical protein V4596_08040 [Bdellovibrionota bacterium]
MKTYYRSKKYFFFLVGLCLLSWCASRLFIHNRSPAAVENQNLFNFFDKGDALQTALHKDIVTSIQVAKAERNFQINVRNFLVKNEQNSQRLCEYFDSYTLTFEAEGMASSGERPTMVITSPCELSAKTNLPVPITIPVEDIYKLTPDDTDISFEVNPKASFSFRNVSEMWPGYWVLSKVQFSHSNHSSREVIIDRREIYTLSKIPVTMSWE